MHNREEAYLIDELRDFPIADFAFHKAMLDALTANIALLDKQGTILLVNASWRRFGQENGIRDPRYGVGANYFAVCRAAIDPNARSAATGIQDVLSGRQSSFYLEYPCHSPDEQRWFALRATPIAGYPGFAVVAHENITERVIAERKLTQRNRIEKANLVTQRFPEWRDRIEGLLAEHQEFREICDDYQELAGWIDDQQNTSASREELEASLELLDSLAEEIGHFLSAGDANESEPR